MAITILSGVSSVVVVVCLNKTKHYETYYTIVNTISIV